MPTPLPTTSAPAENPPVGPPLTLDVLHAVMKEGQEKIDKLNDQLVESLLAGGFKVVINHEMPQGMVAVLPANFRGSLRRAMAKLRAGDGRLGVIYNMNMLS